MPGGGREEGLKYHGWVFRFDADSFANQGIFNTTPNEGSPSSNGATGAGIWQGGGGVTADNSGNLYFMTGNGSDNPSLDSYGDSMVRLSARGNNLQFRGRFGTDDASANLQKRDWDFGSAGPGSARHRPHRGRRQGGEAVRVPDPRPRGQEPLFGAVVPGLGHALRPQLARARHLGPRPPHPRPAVFWNNTLYDQAELDFLKAYHYQPASGTFSTTPDISGDQRMSPDGDFMKGHSTLSWDGTNASSAVLWVRHQTKEDNKGGCGDSGGIRRLTAYNPNPSGGRLQCLFSTTLPDFPHTGVPPTVAGGKVFVVAQNGATHFVRVYKAGTSAPANRDCPAAALPKPPVCHGLIFDTMNTRGMTATGDWAPGSFKSECPPSQPIMALATTPATNKAYSSYCGRTLDGNRYRTSAADRSTSPRPRWAGAPTGTRASSRASVRPASTWPASRRRRAAP